jgi:hypothetical protein
MSLRTVVQPAKSVFKPANPSSAAPESASSASAYSEYIVDEINTYISIRDLRVAAAEDSPNRENLRQAALTNDFVETCLRRPQVVYASQHLPEAQATFERTRCAVVKARLSELRAKSSC